MSDRALSEAAMLASLRDIDLPVTALGGQPADLAMTVGLAGLAALMVAAVLRLLSLRRRPAREHTLRQRLEHSRALPEPERRIALLHLLRDTAPDRYAEVARDLYRPGSAVAARHLEAEVARLV